MGKFIQKLRKSNLEDKILIGKIIALAIVLITLTVIASIEEKKKDELLINTSDSVIILLKENERLKSDINELKREVKGLRNKIDSNENEVPNKVEDKVEKTSGNDKRKNYYITTMNVSAYTAGIESTGKTPDHPDYGKTASGTYVKEGRTVACPKSMPFGTVVEIEGFGKRICEDRGGAITNGKLDIYMESLDEALKFGRIDLEVKVYK